MKIAFYSNRMSEQKPLEFINRESILWHIYKWCIHMHMYIFSEKMHNNLNLILKVDHMHNLAFKRRSGEFSEAQFIHHS